MQTCIFLQKYALVGMTSMAKLLMQWLMPCGTCSYVFGLYKLEKSLALYVNVYMSWESVLVTIHVQQASILELSQLRLAFVTM